MRKLLGQVKQIFSCGNPAPHIQNEKKETVDLSRPILSERMTPEMQVRVQELDGNMTTAKMKAAPKSVSSCTSLIQFMATGDTLNP